MTTKRSIALILSPIGVLLISAGRLIIVANFNTTTAVTIASSGGFVNTLLGSVIPMLPVFIPYLALLLLLFRRFLLSIIAFIFTAFISATSITLAEGLSLAREDWDRLVLAIANHQMLVIVAMLAILALVWAYNQSFAEGMSIVIAMVVAAALLIAVPIAGLSMPLHLASTDEHRLVVRASSGVYGYSGRDILTALAVLAIVFVVLAVPKTFSGLLGGFSWLLIGVVALAATIALFPYLHYIYPVPQNQNYYAEATHAMWLPAERIALNNHHIYNGYVLSSGGAWFTVLLAHRRTIIYLHADDIVGRSVCQPRMPAQPKQNPPLIPWLYRPPRHLPACARHDITMLILGGNTPRNRRSPEKPRNRPHARRTVVGSHPHPQRRPRAALGARNPATPGPPRRRLRNRRPGRPPRPTHQIASLGNNPLPRGSHPLPAGPPSTCALRSGLATSPPGNAAQPCKPRSKAEEKYRPPKRHRTAWQGGVWPLGLLYRNRKWPSGWLSADELRLTG